MNGLAYHRLVATLIFIFSFNLSIDEYILIEINRQVIELDRSYFILNFHFNVSLIGTR